ncbi:MAG: metallophosphoesterase [Chloroflexota bacterium]
MRRVEGSRIARDVLLGTVLFCATLLVLVGLTGVLVQDAGRGPTASALAASGAPSGAATGTDAPIATDRPSTAAPSPAASGLAADPVFVGAGDIGDCGSAGDEATAQLLDGIAGTVFTAGDNVYPGGTAEAYRDCFDPSWGRHRDRIRPAPGNHDWAPGDLDAYFAYFGDAAAGPAGDPWYAYRLGTWQVIVLDSDCERAGGCGPDSSQGRWLAETLAGADARCMLAVTHHPRFSSGQHGDIVEVGPLWDALYAAGVDVVVSGHDHDYERFAPQDPSGREDRQRGLRQFVVGTGGTALRGFPRVAPNSELRAAVAHGVLAFTLRREAFDWQFHAAGSDFGDRGTAHCH